MDEVLMKGYSERSLRELKELKMEGLVTTKLAHLSVKIRNR